MLPDLTYNDFERYDDLESSYFERPYQGLAIVNEPLSWKQFRPVFGIERVWESTIPSTRNTYLTYEYLERSYLKRSKSKLCNSDGACIMQTGLSLVLKTYRKVPQYKKVPQ